MHSLIVGMVPALLVLVMAGCGDDEGGTSSGGGAGSGNNIQAGGDVEICAVDTNVGDSNSSTSINTEQCTRTETTANIGTPDIRIPIRADCSVQSQAQGLCRLPPTQPQ